jgi:hypothetical protein
VIRLTDQTGFVQPHGKHPRMPQSARSSRFPRVIRLTNPIGFTQESNTANTRAQLPRLRGDLGGHLTFGYSRLRSILDAFVVGAIMNSTRDMPGHMLR